MPSRVRYQYCITFGRRYINTKRQQKCHEKETYLSFSLIFQVNERQEEVCHEILIDLYI